MTRNDITTRAKANLAQADEAQTPRQLIESMIPEFRKAMPTGLEAAQLARDALTVLNSSRDLAALRDPTSFLAALMTCAQLGLRPGVGALGHAYIIPFKGKAQFILGYQGMLELANRSGQIASISARIVHEKDYFVLEYGIEDKLVHRPPTSGTRGNPIGYYAVGKRTNGGYSFIYMTKEECEEHRDKFALSKNGPWKAHFDAMALKTVVRKLFTFLPRSTEIQNAIIADESTRINVDPKADMFEVVEHDFTPEPGAGEPMEGTVEDPPGEYLQEPYDNAS